MKFNEIDHGKIYYLLSEKLIDIGINPKSLIIEQYGHDVYQYFRAQINIGQDSHTAHLSLHGLINIEETDIIDRIFFYFRERKYKNRMKWILELEKRMDKNFAS